jgi:hypothetical protein
MMTDEGLGIVLEMALTALPRDTTKDRLTCLLQTRPSGHPGIADVIILSLLFDESADVHFRGDLW